MANYNIDAIYNGSTSLPGTERIRIDGAGNVGINQSSPAYKLDVNGTARIANDMLATGNITIGKAAAYLILDGTNSDAEIYWRANSSNRWAAGMNVGDATENFNIYNYTTATTNLTILKANGNVGIGSTAPAYKLDVNGSIGVVGLRFVDQSTSYFRIFEPAGNIAIYLGNAADPANYYDNSTHFFRNRGGSSTYAVIEGNGNLGIGTTSVTAPLHIYRASNPWIRLNGGGNYSYIRFDDGTSNGYLFKNTSSDTSNGALAGAMYTYTDSGKAFQHIHSGTPLFTILSGGNVGIGTSGPSTLLQLRQTSASHQIFSINRANSATAAIYIGNDSSDNAIIASNNTALRLGKDFTGTFNEYARIDSNGNLGIGTSSPSNKLHVWTGTVQVSGFQSIAGGPLTFLRSDYNGSAAVQINFLNINPSNGYDSDLGIQLMNTGGSMVDVLRIKGSTGNVGIGTTSPAYKLEVASGTSGQQSLVNFRTADSTTANNAGIQIFATPSATATSREAVMALDADGANASGGDYFLIKKRGNSGTTDFEQYSNASMRFGTNFISRATYDMTIANDGNVGIGTTSPGAKLVVQGGSTTDAVLLADKQTTGDGRVATFVNTNASGYSSYIYIGSSPGTDWKLGKNVTNAASNADFNITDHNNNNRFHIKSADGNVGIGTTSPNAKLVIDSSEPRFRLNISGANHIILNHDGSTAILRTESNTPFTFGTNGTEKMRIAAGGSVGIGTTNPSQALEVSGTVKATSYIGDFTGRLVRTSTTQTITGNSALTIDVAAAYIHIITVQASGGTFGISSVTYNNRKAGPEVDEIILIFKWPASGSGVISITNLIGDAVDFNYGKATVVRLTSYKGTGGLWICEKIASNIDYTNL